MSPPEQGRPGLQYLKRWEIIRQASAFCGTGISETEGLLTERLRKIADDHADIRRDFREEPLIWEKLMAASDPFAQVSDFIITRANGRSSTWT